MARIRWAVAGLLGMQSTALLAADCAALKDFKAEDTTITASEPVTPGTLTIADDVPPMKDLPAFCRVAGIMRPTSDSKIRFEVWLPAQDWNGRLLGTGNGGFAGSIGYQEMQSYLRRGYATAGSDAGHQAEGTDATWAFGHPEKVKDFGWRAVHLMTERAKQIVAVYYGKAQQKAYFDSCSDGGREALMEAQRFPEDYDGILAGAPAYAWSTLLASGVAVMQTLGDPKAYISDWKLKSIKRAALDACDMLDGAKDGVIGDPDKCHFDPQVLLCTGEESLDCLTQPQVDALKTLYSGAKNSEGHTFGKGSSMGDEMAWREWIIGEDPEASLGSRFVRNDFRYVVTGDPRWNALTVNVDEMLKLSRDRTAADLDSTNPDLGRFAARGGKLILYHGWNDPAIGPGYTIDYYRSVQQKMSAQKADTFVRLYMVPGMEHCLGGPGASAFGQFGIPTGKGPKYGLFDSLQNWVEKGAPLEDVVATKFDPGQGSEKKLLMTRPLCAYPKVPKYNGSGDVNAAASFTCTAP